MEEGWKAHSEGWNVGKWAQEKRASSYPLWGRGYLTPKYWNIDSSGGVQIITIVISPYSTKSSFLTVSRTPGRPVVSGPLVSVLHSA